MTTQRWRFFAAAAALSVTLLVLVAYATLGAYTFLAPTLPTSDDLRGQNRQVPLRIYSRSGALIAQIGEQLRVPVTDEQIPALVKQAFLAAEDDSFYSHGGVDYLGILRALYVNASTGEASQGASTISQQLARTLFLSSDKRIKRKLQELFLTFRLERDFTKEQILTTYLNSIFFGQRAYGVAAAAEVYFGKSLDELSVAEAATLAGLPKGPSIYNPVKNPERALQRRHYVLQRMLSLHYIDDAAAEQAQREPIRAREYAPLFDVEAPYVAEMARLDLIDRFGEAAVNNGYRVYTTIDSRLQTAAERALRIGLLEYDRRHGYRGPLKRAAVKPGVAVTALEDALAKIPNAGNLKAAVVVSVAPKSARIYVGGQGYSQIEWSGMSWARGSGDASAELIMQVGDIIYVINNGKTAELVQLPQVQGALVSLDPDDGALVAMVGGFDYGISKFNRATQAQRQPGSGFKPFLYSAALEHGFTPASIIMDAPIMADDHGAEITWRPQNSGGEFSGPMRLREALVKSRNLVSIRLLRGTGAGAVIDYAARFGFPVSDMPRNETLALGSLVATPVTVANAYASFANGGYRVNWYFIDRIENESGEVVYRAEPKRACEACEPDAVVTENATPLLVDEKHRAPRIISAANAWLMNDILGDAVRRGTGRGAMVLGRNDLSGKTGTTNDERDTWFNGFNRRLVASVWVGFDQSTPLGEGEQGARTAVPIWVIYMREALRGTPDVPRPRPAGLITARISTETGKLLPEGASGGIDETFLADHLPEAAAPGDTAADTGTETSSETLF